MVTKDTGDSTELLHIYPHQDTVILGGVAQPDDWRREPDPTTGRAIIDRTATIQPPITDAKVVEQRVGLRPTRAVIRLEHESTAGGSLVHNYGHGGAGVSLSWGCAQEVVEVATLRPSN